MLWEVYLYIKLPVFKFSDGSVRFGSSRTFFAGSAPLSELLALLILCFPICFVMYLLWGWGWGWRWWRGWKRGQRVGCQLACRLPTFIGLGLFAPPRTAPPAIPFVWFKGFTCQIWLYLFLRLTRTRTHSHKCKHTTSLFGNCAGCLTF